MLAGQRKNRFAGEKADRLGCCDKAQVGLAESFVQASVQDQLSGLMPRRFVIKRMQRMGVVDGGCVTAGVPVGFTAAEYQRYEGNTQRVRGQAHDGVESGHGKTFRGSAARG